MTKRRQLPEIDACDFEGGKALVIEPDSGMIRSEWLVWHIRRDDRDLSPTGWVRGDWLQGVEQGFEFGEETAIKGFNYWETNGRLSFDRAEQSQGC